MLDHLVLNASALEPARAFYEAALAPLGLDVVHSGPHGVGFGGAHVAFGCADPAAIDALHAAFVFDPDGNNIEAVCHAPRAAS